jgi:predicted Rossmann-fold nucleotide-binding protein
MERNNLPYQPIRQQLYTNGELLQGYKLDDPTSWGRTVDFSIYQHYVKEGGVASNNPYIRMMQALHDNSISQCTTDFTSRRKVAAIMGDHRMRRDSDDYRNIAILARRLSRKGILVCTGGGPGAMEASHLGAFLAEEGLAELGHAIERLTFRPEVPSLENIVNEKGAINEDLVAEAHAWLQPAYEIYASTRSGHESLAIPTWRYGNEPTTMFATHIAKYFQNSVREEGLLAIAQQGIVFSKGKAGTIQEIFQNGAQNFYKIHGFFSPMVLLGVEHWTRKYSVVSVLMNLFEDDFHQYVLVTDDIDEAAQFIDDFKPPSIGETNP